MSINHGRCMVSGETQFFTQAVPGNPQRCRGYAQCMGNLRVSQFQAEQEQKAHFRRGKVRMANQQLFRKVRVYFLELLPEIFPVTFRENSAGTELLKDMVIRTLGLTIFYRLNDT
ncbi:hypothetical protein D9M69_709470 [compost metagenome]